MRLESGTYSWGSEAISKPTRIVGVVYNASNNELVRTNTLVKGAIIQIDATPFRQWYENRYAQLLGKKRRQTAEEEKKTMDELTKDMSKRGLAKRQARKSAVESALDDQFVSGRLYAIITSRPGQSGRCDGYILEGKELDFYLRKIRSKK